jgi:hypothetical protein
MDNTNVLPLAKTPKVVDLVVTQPLDQLSMLETE